MIKPDKDTIQHCLLFEAFSRFRFLRAENIHALEIILLTTVSKSIFKIEKE